MSEGVTGGSRLSPALVDAYRATHYAVAGEPPFVLRVDERSAELADCHRRHGVRASAFLTAWNPGSRLGGQDANAAAQAELERRLDVLGFTWLAARGIDPAGHWPTEASVLVLGLERGAACALAREFGQSGLLVAADDAVPRLVLLG